MKKHSLKSLFKIFGLVLLFTQITKPAHAFVTNLEDLCNSIHAKRPEKTAPESKKLSSMTQLRMQVTPREFIGVVSNNVVARSSDKTIIFTMSPEGIIPNSAAIKKDEKLNYKRSKRTQSNIKELLKTQDVPACLLKAHSLKMTNQQLVEYGEILKQSALNNELYQASMFIETADKAAKKFKNGEARATSEAEMIFDSISSLSEERYHFIFVFHADPKGRLIDHSNYIVEKGFFKEIADRAASISIFSCYPDKVASYYSKDLDYLARVGVSVYQPELKKELKEINSTPLNLLEEFSRQLEKQL